MYQEAEEEGEVLKLIANKRAPGRTEPTNGRFCVPPMYRGDGSEVSLIEKRELGSIAREFQNRVEGEVWEQLRHLFLALLKEYNERMGLAPPAGNPLVLANIAHQQDDAV